MRCLLPLLLLILPLSAGEPKLDDRLNEAKAKAAAEGKYLLLDFYTSWCKPCKIFDRDARLNPEVKEALKPFVLVKIDAETKAARYLNEKHRVNRFPTFVVANHKGREIMQWSGYGRAAFLAKLAKGYAKAEKKAKKRKQRKDRQ